MTSRLSRSSSFALAASQRPPPVESVAGISESLQRRPSTATDVLCIGANPILAVYLAGLFEKFGWTVRLSADLGEARDFLADHRAAVVICEESLPDAAWQEAVFTLDAIPDPPMLVVIGRDKSLLDEVLALGGFDVLTRPLREAEVIWTVASAWHHWMKRMECPRHRGARTPAA